MFDLECTCLLLILIFFFILRHFQFAFYLEIFFQNKIVIE